MKTDMSGAAACPNATEKPVYNAFTQHLDPAHKGVDVKKLDRDALHSRRQTAVVARNLAAGNNLSSIHSLSRKASSRYFPPVQGAAASQPENDKRHGMKKARI